ncbi:hypothetical protein GBA52_010203 [Prunus armeniaca]|nr:hypothetical protein GBA52_010203 [Prunus armeniaca]
MKSHSFVSSPSSHHIHLPLHRSIITRDKSKPKSPKMLLGELHTENSFKLPSATFHRSKLNGSGCHWGL